MREWCRPIGWKEGKGPRMKPRGRAMWQMSDFEAAGFLLIATLMVALAVSMAWE